MEINELYDLLEKRDAKFHETLKEELSGFRETLKSDVKNLLHERDKEIFNIIAEKEKKITIAEYELNNIKSSCEKCELSNNLFKKEARDSIRDLEEEQNKIRGMGIITKFFITSGILGMLVFGGYAYNKLEILANQQTQQTNQQIQTINKGKEGK